MKRKVAVFICMALCLSQFVGCGQQTNRVEGMLSESAAQTTEQEESGQKEQVGSLETKDSNAKDSREDEEKTSITDFYQYANEAWLNTVTPNEENPSFLMSDALDQKEMDTILEWTTMNPSAFSEDAGMYRIMTLLDQVQHPEQYREICMEKLEQDFAIIDKVDSLDALYELYQDAFFGAMNSIWYVDMDPLGDKRLYTTVVPQPFFIGIPESSYGKVESEMASMLTNMGLPEKEAASIAEKAAPIEVEILKYRAKNSETNSVIAWDKFVERDKGLQPQILDTLIARKMVNLRKTYYAMEDIADIYNSLYTPKNLEGLKAYLKVAIMVKVMCRCDMNCTGEMFRAYEHLYGIPEGAMGWNSENVLQFIQTMNYEGTIANYYTGRVVGKEKLEEVKQMSQDVIAGVREMIRANPWLTVHGKEMAQRKINHLGIFFGTDGTEDYYDEMPLADNPYDNAKNVIEEHVKVQIAKTDELSHFFEIEGRSPLEHNATYFTGQNAFMMGASSLSWLAENPEATYEEMLGELGAVMAHEIGHAYDFYGCRYDEYGQYNPWMTEKEYQEYLTIEDKIKNFYDGKKTLLGNTINGELVKEEAFADCMAVECCLKILEKRENPNYEAFFTAYARSYAMSNTKEDEASWVEEDAHVPSRERINYTLAQFDRFYDTFDVKEDSPYYVRKENRAWELWKTED